MEKDINFAKIKDIKQRRKAFWEDTYNFYHNYRDRCAFDTSKVKCCYSPTDTSLGCAIGRFLPLETANLFDTKGGDINTIFSTGLSVSLPLWMLEMGKEYLQLVQSYHDTLTLTPSSVHAAVFAVEEYLKTNELNKCV